MYISKQKLDEIKKEYSTLIMTDSDVVDAFNLVHDILMAEAEAIRAKASYATASISRLEQSAYEAFSIGGEIDNGVFEEHD